MSSLLRTIHRRSERRRWDYEPKPQATKVEETGCTTLHPTKGWKRVSYARLRARELIMSIHNRVSPRRAKKAAKVWRTPAPLPPSVETRQQRRYAARKEAK